MPVSAGRYAAGHGLGYGETVISDYKLTAASDHVAASVKVRNSGNFHCRETVQVYARTADESLRLIDFQHCLLAPAEEALVTFELRLDALGVPGASSRLELAPGRHEILVGKSKGRLLAASVEIAPATARTIAMRESGFLRLATG